MKKSHSKHVSFQTKSPQKRSLIAKPSLSYPKISNFLQKSSKLLSQQQVRVQKQIKNAMLSQSYQTIFNRLMQITTLKQFLRQSHQYVQLSSHKDIIDFKTHIFTLNKRFSFSLRSSICSFLIKDYRFLNHYYQLLIKERPDHKEQFRNVIYQNYKDQVLIKDKFERIFNPNYQRKLYASYNSTKSLGKLKYTQNKSMTKLIYQQQNNQVLNNIKKITQSPDNRLRLNKTLQVIKPSELQTSIGQKLKKQVKFVTNKIQFKFPKQSNSKIQIKQEFSLQKSRRRTIQNIQCIKQTLEEIQEIQKIGKIKSSQIKQTEIIQLFIEQKNLKQNSQRKQNFSQVKSKKSKSKPKQKQNKNTSNNIFLTQSKVKKQQNDTDLQDEYLNSIFKTQNNRKKIRNNNKKVVESQLQHQKRLKGLTSQKKVTQRKKPTKTFQQFMEKYNPKLLSLRPVATPIGESSIIKKVANPSSSISQPLHPLSLHNLTHQQLQIINLLPSIKNLGDVQAYQIVRDIFFYKQLGVFRGYKVQYVMAWFKMDLQAFRCIYMQKMHLQSEQLDKQQFSNHVRQAIPDNDEITLLIIFK